MEGICSSAGSAQFNADQIFNWSYADEQEAKENWDSLDYNPYKSLPRLSMYTYQLSPMIRETVQKGLDLSGEDGAVDYAFDLNEFFATNESRKFIHEDEIRKFLHALSTQEKYPYSTPQLRKELSHTLWLLNRVDSAKALAKLLREDPVFSEYEIVLAAGDSQLETDVESNDKAYGRVKAAIASHEKTITLSVGQLTVGVTIPEWSGVLMLCNLQSPSSYMQAAFRAQNPCILTSDGKRFRKETAYVFDFDPARTLIIFNEFANNLSPDTASGRGTTDEIVIGKAQDVFGDKIYEDLADAMLPAADLLAEPGSDYGISKKQVDQLTGTLKETLKAKIVDPVIDAYDVKKGTINRLEKEMSREIDRRFEQLTGDYEQQVNIAKVNHEKNRMTAENEEQVRSADDHFKADMEAALNAFMENVKAEVDDTIRTKPQELVEKLEKHKAEEEKRSIEDDVRARLRGFCRTIPSFIMAYGDGHLNLQNFDDYTEDDVFLEVTGITEGDFRFLRDGGDYTDENGETAHFAGHIFDETVFDDSVSEFWKKKLDLADYFDESKDEDIFDYIPPQKTNQIFTPRRVVQKMVDDLESLNPGCFDDPDKTFADLYMKSGLYITEIVKRLYRSERMKELFPNDNERIRHILRHQVYGMAPTRIIYLIATNYILGFDETLKEETKNFVQADAAEAAKNGTLQALVDRFFG